MKKRVVDSNNSVNAACGDNHHYHVKASQQRDYEYLAERIKDCPPIGAPTANWLFEIGLLIGSRAWKVPDFFEELIETAIQQGRNIGSSRPEEHVTNGIKIGLTRAEGETSRLPKNAQHAIRRPSSDYPRKAALTAWEEGVDWDQSSEFFRYFCDYRRIPQDGLPDKMLARVCPNMPTVSRSFPRHQAKAILFRFQNLETFEPLDAWAALFIDDDGSSKAWDGKAKLGLGTRAGNNPGIILGDLADNDSVVIGEGIESVLSATCGLWPGIALFSISYGAVKLPRWVEYAVIAADYRAYDRAHAQSEKLYEHNENISVAITTTLKKQAAEDFNDLIQVFGYRTCIDLISEQFEALAQ